MEGVIEFNADMQVDDLQFSVKMEETEGEFSASFDSLQSTAYYENDYNNLDHKPQINSVTLIGNKTGEQLNLQAKMDTLTNMDIERLINSFV